MHGRFSNIGARAPELPPKSTPMPPTPLLPQSSSTYVVVIIMYRYRLCHYQPAPSASTMPRNEISPTIKKTSLNHFPDKKSFEFFGQISLGALDWRKLGAEKRN